MRETDSKRKKHNDLKSDLERACEGLIFISETDAAVEPFIGSKVNQVTPTSLRMALEDPVRESPIEVVDTFEFFEKLTVPRSWHTASQTKITKKFRRLQVVLESELTDLRVFKLGRIRLDIFIVGIDREGRLAGVRTKAVET